MNRHLARLIFISTCAVFLFFGVYNAGVGPILPELSNRTGASLYAVGAIITAIYSGSLITQFSSGTVIRRFGRLPAMTLSIFLMSAGIIGLGTAPSLTTLIIACFFLGLGQGGVDIISNTLVTLAYPDKSIQVLNILHLAYGAGAALGPLLISLSLTYLGAGMVVQWVVAFFFLLSGLCFLYITKQSLNVNEAAEETESAASHTEKLTQAYSKRIVWLLGIMMLLVVGIQFSAGTWATVFLTSTLGIRADQAALITSLYWLLISVGRIFAVMFTKYTTPKTMLFVHLIGALLWAILYALTVGIQTVSVFSFLLISLFFGGMYPLLLAFIPKYFGCDIDKVSSIVVSLGTVGGLILPWVNGLILNGLSPALYTWSLVFSILTVILLSLVFVKKVDDLHVAN